MHGFLQALLHQEFMQTALVGGLLASLACGIMGSYVVVNRLSLVMALLTLPAAMAAQYLRSLAPIMAVAALLGMLFTSGGIALSYGPDLPAGATMILVAGTAYLVSLAAVGFAQRWRT
jgi:zinc transport system permease protein